MDILDIFEEQETAAPTLHDRKVPALLNDMAVREYLLVLKPTSTIWDEMVQIKQQVATWCHAPDAVNSRPYITLLRFAQVVPAEEGIVKKLALLTQALLPLRITLENYSGIPKHTLEVPVAPCPLLDHFLQQLKALTPVLTLYRKQKPVLVKKPTIGIARQLTPGAYEDGLARLQPLEYSNVFVAKECLLLSRPRGAKGYKLSETFAFKGKAVAPRPQQVRMF